MLAIDFGVCAGLIHIPQRTELSSTELFRALSEKMDGLEHTMISYILDKTAKDDKTNIPA